MAAGFQQDGMRRGRGPRSSLLHSSVLVMTIFGHVSSLLSRLSLSLFSSSLSPIVLFPINSSLSCSFSLPMKYDWANLVEIFGDFLSHNAHVFPHKQIHCSSTAISVHAMTLKQTSLSIQYRFFFSELQINFENSRLPFKNEFRILQRYRN